MTTQQNSFLQRGENPVITISDINTNINYEPRIQDLLVAKALGFKQTHNIRKLITRYLQILEKMGQVCHMVQQTSKKGGRPATVYYLNEKQALFICTKSETLRAVEVTIQMVEAFYQLKHGTPEKAPQLPLQQQKPILDTPLTKELEGIYLEALNVKEYKTMLADAMRGKNSYSAQHLLDCIYQKNAAILLSVQGCLERLTGKVPVFQQRVEHYN